MTLNRGAMGDVFVSYKAEDRARVAPLVAALEADGLSVWWDAHIGGGEDWRESIQEHLDAARCVIVAWSSRSVAPEGRFVRDEASRAQRRGTYLPVRIDAVEPPLGFGETQALDLVVWRGDRKDARYQAVLAAVRAMIAGETVATVGVAGPRRRAPWRRGDAGSKRPAWVAPAIVALVMVAVIAAVALLKPGGLGGGLDSHRIAFYGITAEPGDTVASGMAKSATDEIYQALTAADLQTVSRAQTQGVPLAEQLARAKSLGARFALAGEVRTEGKTAHFLLRLDDAATAKTLWEGSAPGAASDTVSLPVLAGAQATILMRCLIGDLDDVGHASEQLMAVLPRACAETFAGTNETVKLWSQIATLAPKSAAVRSGLAWVTLNAVKSPADFPSALAEATKEAQEALRIDPKNPLARGILAGAARVAGRPLAEFEQMNLAAINEAPKHGLQVGVSLTYPISGVVAIRVAAGRARDALTFARQNVEGDPTNPTIRSDLAGTLSRAGRPAEATQVYDQSNARYPRQGGWEQWMYDAAFNGLGGVDHALTVAPASVSQDSVACWKDLIAAAASSSLPARLAGEARAKQCMSSGNMLPRNIAWVAPVLGDVDLGFNVLGALPGRALPPFLFDKAMKPLRADPRFVPLVTKLGLMDYWKTTGSRPDICDSEDIPLCRLLKAPS